MTASSEPAVYGAVKQRHAAACARTIVNRKVLRTQGAANFDVEGLAARAHIGALEPRYIASIMTCPNPEQETWVAPSIKRAKS
jgi:hypothetical protein